MNPIFLANHKVRTEESSPCHCPGRGRLGRHAAGTPNRSHATSRPSSRAQGQASDFGGLEIIFKFSFLRLKKQ